MTTYNVTVGVRVDDKKQLHAAALKHLIEIDGMDEGDAKDMLKHQGRRELDIGACLQVIIDPGSIPGCDVIQSDVETCPDFD